MVCHPEVSRTPPNVYPAGERSMEKCRSAL